MDQLNELGFYVLAGAPQTPAELIDEVPGGEALGLGSAFISERLNIKEALTLAVVAFGPNSLALAGRCFDAVVLHTFFTDETVERCVATVRGAAEAAGRDPASVRIWSCYATIGDHLPEPLRLKKTVGRLAT